MIHGPFALALSLEDASDLTATYRLVLIVCAFALAFAPPRRSWWGRFCLFAFVTATLFDETMQLGPYVGVMVEHVNERTEIVVFLIVVASAVSGIVGWNLRDWWRAGRQSRTRRIPRLPRHRRRVLSRKGSCAVVTVVDEARFRRPSERNVEVQS